MKKRRRGSYKKTNLEQEKLLGEAKPVRNLLKGFQALAAFWKRGGSPDDLRRHYFMTWFALSNGNAVQTGRLTGLHRNAIITNFRYVLKHRSTFKLRRLWQDLQQKYHGKPFADRMKLLYDRSGVKPAFPLKDNRGLVGLWLHGFPLRAATSHYVLYYWRKGLTWAEIGKKMGKAERHSYRYREYAANPGARYYKWFQPLKIKESDWYMRDWRKGRKKLDRIRYKKSYLADPRYTELEPGN